MNKCQCQWIFKQQGKNGVYNNPKSWPKYLSELYLQ
jgi:hypothetical protein